MNKAMAILPNQGGTQILFIVKFLQEFTEPWTKRIVDINKRRSILTKKSFFTWSKLSMIDSHVI